jgi:lipopolysaccharide biosynthesis glycosyltransferase
LHFITADKPWHSWYENSLSKHYWKYIDVSPWAGATPVPPTRVGKALRLARLRYAEGKSSESIQLYERILTALGKKA